MLTTVIDIETVPDADAAAQADIDLGDSFPAWPLHQIACVSILTVQRDINWKLQFGIGTLSRATMSEGAIIADLERYLENAREVVTFNGRSFDVPVLMARAAVARQACPNIAHLMAQPRRVAAKHVDVLEEITGHGAASRVKLAEFCAAFAIPAKVDTHGSDVSSLVAENRWDEVTRYCETDVTATWLALQFWRAAERNDPCSADEAWAQLADWIQSKQPRLTHLLPYAKPPTPARGGRALDAQRFDTIRF